MNQTTFEFLMIEEVEGFYFMSFAVIYRLLKMLNLHALKLRTKSYLSETQLALCNGSLSLQMTKQTCPQKKSPTWQGARFSTSATRTSLFKRQKFCT